MAQSGHKIKKLHVPSILLQIHLYLSQLTSNTDHDDEATNTTNTTANYSMAAHPISHSNATI